MKFFLRRTGLFYAYNTLAIFIGSMVSAIPIVLLRAIFQTDAYTFESNLITGLVDLIIISGILLFLIQREVYETRQFSFTSIILPTIIVCVIRWSIWYFSKGGAAFWVTGASTYFSPLIFHNVYFGVKNHESVLYDLFSTIICDVLVTIPIFIGSSYWGYKRRKREIEEMIEEHEVNTK